MTKMPANPVPGGNYFLGLYRDAFSLCPHMVFPLLSFHSYMAWHQYAQIRHLALQPHVPLLTFLKAPSSTIVTWGIKFQHIDFMGTQFHGGH